MPALIVDGKNMFRSKSDALVCPANSVGVMGKGIALEFKKRFPEIVRPYVRACKLGVLKPGHIMMVRIDVQPNLFEHRRPSVVIFTTKDHWEDPSRLEWIESGLADLRSHCREWDLRTISMPQIGCGLGGLSWDDVQPLVHKYFDDAKVTLKVYTRAIKDFGEAASGQH
ncbi:macro domain-containing protein [bacterium]|nr:macro domain-containing protein [bacterium]